ncbi:MAG: anthrone oxygenase family protein [Planctomycetota bacterium]
MEALLQGLAIAGVLGAGAMGGTFYAFSSFVLPALGQLPSERGAAAMQTINVVVLRPSFLGVFVGTALLSLVSLALAAWRWGTPGTGPLAAGAGLYLLGTFAVTAAGNVPLNDALAEVEPESDEGRRVWSDYLTRWARWNHLRSAAALAATVCFAFATG